MSKPINDRDLPEEVMASMMRLEEEAYRAGQHGCCEEGAAKMANPSCFGACPEHGPRSRAALSLLCHSLAQWAEWIVEEAATTLTPHLGHSLNSGHLVMLRALAPTCPKCGGWGSVKGGGFCDCSRGKAYRHWCSLDDAPAPSEGKAP